MTKFILASVLVFNGISAWAQSEDDQYSEPGEEPAAPTIESPAPSAKSGKPAKAVAAGSVEDYFKPGWNTNKLDTGVGVSSSFLGGGTTIILDTGLTRRSSWSYYFGYNKTADTFAQTTTTTATGVGTVSTSTVNSSSGIKSPKVFSIGSSWNRRLFKNNFIQARWGVFGGIDYYTKVSYARGSSTSTVSSATPTTVSYSESSLGSTTVEKDPAFKLGPMFDSYLYLRWFPNIQIGMQAAILYSTNIQTKTKTRQVTQAYTVTNGVAGTPSSYTAVDTNDTASTGGAGSTFAPNGSTFSFTGNFVLRYVW